MGAIEDMNWLKTNERGWARVFREIAGRGKTSYPALKEAYGGVDWWPVKSYVRLLIERGLVMEDRGILSPTEHGKKVFEMIQTVSEFAPI